MRSKTAAALCAVVMGLVLAGCETMQPASYANYGDNTFALHKFEGAKLRLGTITDQSNFDSGCRLVGPIKTSGNRPLAEFIRDSFNDELKFAGLYSDDPDTTRLTATLQAAGFSSMSNMTRGHWTFSLQLANPANGRTLVANSSYDFDSGFSAAVACANVSNALTPAVQRLINTAVTDPQFRALIAQPR
ncbi:MAG: hypothetical protein J0H30_03665 [Alphaproteobacteria bacterium]|nr:hypothetical protein [Alphaproteobacteria bacterium]MBN9570157.1 hypothetical protein [Alphaproteobacteria bacterium]OJU56709.1 MAG: hypothetical protein BGO00_01560 [Alphaproteobacteria bacterium 62-8]